MEKFGGNDGIGMPGLSNVKVARGSLQRQIEKGRQREEKQINRIKKPNASRGVDKLRGVREWGES
jgi:hypothetical protein